MALRSPGFASCTWLADAQERLATQPTSRGASSLAAAEGRSSFGSRVFPHSAMAPASLGLVPSFGVTAASCDRAYSSRSSLAASTSVSTRGFPAVSFSLSEANKSRGSLLFQGLSHASGSIWSSHSHPQSHTRGSRGVLERDSFTALSSRRHKAASVPSAIVPYPSSSGRLRRPRFSVSAEFLGRGREDGTGTGKAVEPELPEPWDPQRVPVPASRRLPPGREHEDFLPQPNGAVPGPGTGNSFNGVFLLLLLNVAAFVADHLLKLPAMRWLYLHHASARWYQFVTSTFCHASWNHLSSNLFFLYIFGRLVEEEEGSVGLWATYLVTGAGANLVSWLVLPKSVVSVGASGAVFGLFAVSVLTRLRFNWRKLLEVVILGQFVIERLIVEAQSSAMQAGRGGMLVHSSVNHVAHLAGALMGVLLMWLVSRIPDPQDHPPHPRHS